MRRLAHEDGLALLTLALGLPALATALLLIVRCGLSARLSWTLGVALVGCWLGLALTVRERVLQPLQTLANLLLALREGDYSLRARGASPDDDLGVALLAINELGAALQRQRNDAIADLRRALREEERQAWQRLLRVLSHEINNSLAPVGSIAESLLALLRQGPPAEAAEDMQAGLQVIARRSESLARFLSGYLQLARLPPPRLGVVKVLPWVRRGLRLEPRLEVALRQGPDEGLCVAGDADQLDQLLINLVRNAVDAALQTGGGVELSYRRAGPWVELRIDDEGPGLQNPGNLFVPLYTTKPGGTGIGLVLSRQIAETHGGLLELRNRDRGRGCQVILRLPLS